MRQATLSPRLPSPRVATRRESRGARFCRPLQPHLHRSVIGPKAVATANALHHEAFTCVDNGRGVFISKMAFTLAGRNGEVIASVAVDSDALKRSASRSFSGVHESLRPKAIPGAPGYADNGTDRSCGPGGFFPHPGLASRSAARAVHRITLSPNIDLV